MAEPELHVSSRLRKLLPPLTTDEYKQLERNILADGEIRETILYWFDGSRNNIVDGMHRYRLAEKHGLPYKTKELKLGDTYDEVEVWMLDHQLGRRNLLKPQEVRRVRGELYNRLKRQDGGHGNQNPTRGAGFQNDTPPPSAAKKVAEKAGVSESTVKRDGVRAEILGGCSSAIQKGISAGAFTLTDAELKVVAAMVPGDQAMVATQLRKGLSPDVKSAKKELGITTPRKTSTKKKPPKKLDRGGYYKQWEKSLGPVLRLVEKIADGVSEKHGENHRAVREHLDNATDEMMEWMQIRK